MIREALALAGRSPAMPAAVVFGDGDEGVAGAVTGSLHLIETGRTRVLLDSGLFQGRRDEAWLRNARPRLDARSVDVVVLSHVHIDHSGAQPPSIARASRDR